MSDSLRPFLRFVPVSGLVTLIDFGTSYWVLQSLGFSYALATVTGNIIGGVMGFILSRNWVFKESKPQNQSYQIIKYGLVSGGNSLMNTSGVWILSKMITLDYLMIRTLVGTFVFVVYSYGLNRWFVFNTKNHEKISIQNNN